MVKGAKQPVNVGTVNMMKLYTLAFFALVIYGCVGYYNDTQERLELAAQNLAKAEVAAEANKLVIQEMQKNNAENEKHIEDLARELKTSTVYKNELIQKLRRHNLTVLTLQKPGLIEKRVNDASAKVLADLESVTAVN